MSIQSAVSNVITRVTQSAMWVIHSLVERVSALFTRTVPQSVVTTDASFNQVVLELKDPADLQAAQNAVNIVAERQGILEACGGRQTPPSFAASPEWEVRDDLRGVGIAEYLVDPTGDTASGLIAAARLPSDELRAVVATAERVREEAAEEAYVAITAQRAACAATLMMQGKAVPEEYLKGVNSSVLTPLGEEKPKTSSKESDLIEAARAATQAARYLSGDIKTLPKSHQRVALQAVNPASSAKRGGWFSW